ncbi:hypothetical protein B0H10DRAFT_1774914, partial [Mycena sp. CBHHK59/15]
MVNAFLKHVLCWEDITPGWFGHTKSFYGTVEQQGRLTLHLHLLLWIQNALSPQQIRDRLLDPNSIFAQHLVDYIESVHQGEFLTGTFAEVNTRIPEKDYKPPTHTLPLAPPPLCAGGVNCICEQCQKLEHWWTQYELEVDDLLLRSNMHDCRRSTQQEKEDDNKKNWRVKVKGSLLKNKKYERKGCLTKEGICRARFPRDIFPLTQIDPVDGHIDLKKLEPKMNTFTPLITYLNRCNTDVTCLLSGTAVKAVVSYVSDYVSKLSLKTYQIFATIYDVF